MRNLGREFGTIVDQRLKALGKRAFTIETENSLPADSIRNVMRAENPSGPTLSKVQQICDALGLELYIGPPRANGPLKTVDLDEGEFVHIPLHSALVAAGGGVDNGTDAEIIDHLAFQKSWLQRIGVSASSAVLARASGDSMMPLIHPGDLILIDTSRADIPVKKRASRDTRPPPIYAVLDDGAARVKRVERPDPELIVLLSDNSAYGPEVLTGSKTETLNVIGKVVWWGHTNRE